MGRQRTSPPTSSRTRGRRSTPASCPTSRRRSCGTSSDAARGVPTVRPPHRDERNFSTCRPVRRVEANVTYYQLLGVPQTATLDQLHRAYRGAVRRFHPDVNKAPNAAQVTAKLNEAWHVLRE